VGEAYSCEAGGIIAGGLHLLPSWIPAVGACVSIGLNTLEAINPSADPLANPNYPSAAPWERSAGWMHCLDYGGVIMADDVGQYGSLMFYGAAGHSACNPTMWCGFDLASQQWSRVGKRSLPNDDMYLGLDAYPGVLDAIWGDYDGSASAWGAFAQPGYNPPAGAHSYAGLAYRPAAKAGNAKGQMLYPLNATGATAGTAARGSWIWDADSELFSRSSNLRPAAGGATVGGTQYFESIDTAFAINAAGSLWLQTLDCFDWDTTTWTRRYSATADFYADLSAISFAHPSALLYIMCDPVSGSDPTHRMWAAPVDKVKAGTSWTWAALTVELAPGADWPPTASWCYHAEKNAWYAVSGVPGSHDLWKLTAPSDTQAGALSGTWIVSKHVFTGDGLYCKDAAGTTTTVGQFRSLTYSRRAKCLLWISPYIGGVVQAIRPVN